MKVQTNNYLTKHELGDYAFINCETEEFGFPLSLNVETIIDEENPVIENSVYNLSFKFICDYEQEDQIKLFNTKEEYYEKVGDSFDCETVMPIGTFKNNNEAIINCTIDEVFSKDDFPIPENIAIINGKIQGNIVDIMIIFASEEERDKFDFKAGQTLRLSCEVEIWPDDYDFSLVETLKTS